MCTYRDMRSIGDLINIQFQLIRYAHCRSALLNDMTSTAIVCTLLIIVVSIIKVICKEHVPSLNEISRINDPVLKEVFDSSNISVHNKASYEDTPRLVSSGSPISTQESSYIGEVPIEHRQPLGPVPPRRDGLIEIAETGANVFATGANALYRGAASVGQAFGIQPQSYEAPLFNAAAHFFGKKK